MTEQQPIVLADHLARLRERSGLTLDEFAKQAGYKGASSVQRYFEDKSLKQIKPSIAAKLAKALYMKGDPPIRIIDLAPLVLDNKNIARSSKSLISHLLQLEFDHTEGPEAVEYPISDMLNVAGDARISTWTESKLSIESSVKALDIPFEIPANDKYYYALCIADQSVNRVAPQGYYAICRRYVGRSSMFPNGCFVHVQRSRDGLIEWSIRRVVWSDSGMELWADSDHPDHQNVVRLAEELHGIQVLGLVVSWYKPA